MLRTKKDVDRHVKEIFIKLKSSEEKTLRCYNIAKLYYNVGDYETAKKYVSNYLEVRDKSAGAHKLLGEVLEALGQKEQALTQYIRSVELDPIQDELVLKVCELFSNADINIDIRVGKYWVERADKIYPHHPIVFELKEKLLTEEKSNENEDTLEKLILSELSVRQRDVHLQIKLLKHYMGNHRLEDAYKQAIEIETEHRYRNSIFWYQSLSELLLKCKESKQSDWTFWVFYISVLERYLALCFKEQGNIVRENVSEVTQAVFIFDQTLYEFKLKKFSKHSAFIEHMLLHMSGQLHFHLACLILRKTKVGEENWSEAGRLCGPLLLTALHVTPIDPTSVWIMHLKDQHKTQVHVWYREGSYRCSQAGHVLQDYARDNTKKLLDKIDKFCTSPWRERVYERIFISRLYQDGKMTSYFTNCSAFNPPLRLCSINELKRFDEISKEVWPDSLHHHVWLGLRSLVHNSQHKDDGPQPNQTSRVFYELQYSVYNLSQAAPDSLSRLDIDAFLNAAIICASSLTEEQQLSGRLNPNKLPTLPADLTNTLCTSAQEQWWLYAYKVYSLDKQRPLGEDLSELRLELQKGLEVIRCIGNHGLHPVLLVHLARIFHYRAERLREVERESGKLADLEARSELYWSAAVPLLERLQNKQNIRITNPKYFNYQGKDLSDEQLVEALEEGKLLLAQRYVRDKQYEKAIKALQALKCPEASFQQGQMYEKLSEKIVNSIPKESLTSEMRSQHIVMLLKAKDCFYLTLDRLRSPGTNPTHPLNSELSTCITDIENKLKRVDPDLAHGDLSKSEPETSSCGSFSSAHSNVDQGVLNSMLPTFTGLGASVNMITTPKKNTHHTPKQSSTPFKPHHQDLLDSSRNRSEARPSPERLDAQIRAINQMIHTKDNMLQSITKQNKAILELKNTVMEKMDKLANEISELRKDFQKQHSQRLNVNPTLEEDLCALNEKEWGEMNYNANQAGAAASIPSNLFPSAHRQGYPQFGYYEYYGTSMQFPNQNTQAIPPLYPSNVYPMPVLLPNAKLKMPNILQQDIVMPPTHPPMQIPLQKAEMSKPEAVIKDAPVNKIPPVNVSITTSDVLPTTVPSVQPTLSVTIPPHFRQGTVPTLATTEQAVPHCYQITMPSQAKIPTTVNLPQLSSTLTTTPGNVSVSDARQDTSVCSAGSPVSSDHEHDPIPDFAPVIPLPALVEVTTGEEDQVTLFCARAKLYRFVDNEWKERGIGDVKLLKTKDEKVRLVMRREQVLKVCANHYVTPDMELVAKANIQGAWVWVANDFADGELKIEQFCIKFKTATEAASFKEHFDKAKAMVAASGENVTDNSVKTMINVKEKGKEKVETKTTEQKSSGKIVLRPSKIVTATTTTVGLEPGKTSTTTTVAGGFSFKSAPIFQNVTVAEAPKSSVKTTPSPFAGLMFNKSITTTESFANAAQKSTVPDTTTSQLTFSGGKISSPLSTPISFLQQPTIAATNENASPNATQLSLRKPHGAQSHVSVTAVGVQDHEEVLFDEKVSLEHYGSNAKQWTNEGIGQMMILWSSKTKKIRLLMTDENTSKICHNCNVRAKMVITFKDGNNNVVNWNVPNGLNDKQEMFAATFKTSSLATLFHDLIVQNQSKMVDDCITIENLKKQVDLVESANKGKPQEKSLAEMFKPPTGSWECSDCYTRNEATASKCIACEAPNPSDTSKSNDTLNPSSTNEKPFSVKFTVPSSSWKCKRCELANAGKSNYCVVCDTPKDPSLPQKSQTEGFQINTSSVTATPTFTFGIPQDVNKKGTSTLSFRPSAANDTSTESKSGFTAAMESNKPTEGAGTKLIFGMPQKPSTPTNKESTFLFGSAGKPLEFNYTTNTSSAKSDGEDNSEDDVIESEDIHFSPIIPLPDTVEVKTGEEEEDVIYDHRAKLFRYDKSVNDWKERGVGDIKLLKHKETGRARMVMRREKVLKVCLNHAVLPTLELKAKDERTWIWIAADYSEGEIEHSSFACRFISSDVARAFKDAVDKLKAELSSVEKASETPVKTSSEQEIEVLYEMKVTPKEKEAALKLQLPENFYAYQQKPECPGCIGCRESDIPLFQNNAAATASTLTSKLPAQDQKPTTTLSTGQIFSKPSSLNTLSLFGNTAISATNDKKTSITFGMPQTETLTKETEKSAIDKHDVLKGEHLKICSPVVATQSPTTTATPFSFLSTSTIMSTASTPSIFDAAKSNDTAQNIFGGRSKQSSVVLRPSNIPVNNAGTVFSNEGKTQSKTATTTVAVFAAAPSIFDLSTLQTTANSISFPIVATTNSMSGLVTKFPNSIPSTTASPFSFPSFLETCIATSPFTTTNPATTGSAINKERTDDVSLLPSTEISFSALAAKSSQTGFRIDPGFSFADTGSAVFGNVSKSTTNKTNHESKNISQGRKDENKDEENDENDNENDPYFEPIVPLPDIVEVRTGEEDEDIVFSERAKLYRFDNVTREWKERGVGAMKILHHKQREIYRLLLRREQVYKVVCNVLLTSDITFSKLSTSMTTWIWAGMNHAEETPCVENLAVRFKTTQLADKFKTAVDDIQQTLNKSRKE